MNEPLTHEVLKQALNRQLWITSAMFALILTIAVLFTGFLIS
jgi:hypothetical protein